MDQFHTYEAHAFHDQFNKGRSSGIITVTITSIEFVPADASFRSIYFPVDLAQLKLGGASNRLVFITHPNFPDWKLYTSDQTILKNPNLHLDPSLRKQLYTARNVRQMQWVLLFVVAFSVVAVPISMFVFMDSITAIIAQQVPIEWEERLGKTAFGQYQIDTQLVATEEGEAAMTALTSPLINAVKDKRFTFKIYIADSPELNAFALPGGIIVIHTGLILAADNAEEVLGVLAHELSHVTERHGIRNIIAATGTYTLIQAMFGDVSGLLATVVNATPFLLNQSYSRAFEADVDAKGVQLLKQANINPTGMISFFEKIIEEEQSRMAHIEDSDTRALLERGVSFLSSHPSTIDRIASLTKQIGSVKSNYRNLDAEFVNLRELVRNFVADSIDDQ